MEHHQTNVLYFAYGEHMNEIEMKKYFPHARMVAVSALKGFRLCFLGKDGMAIPGTQAHAGAHLPGRVWAIQAGDLQALDRLAGESVYTHREIHTVSIHGLALPVLAYISKPGQRHGRPGFLTFDFLREAYETAGEDPACITGLAMACAP